MMVLSFLAGLAFIVTVSSCHKYVYGRHSVLAAFYLPIMPVTLWKAARKWWYAKD
jgi:hypothetical protein